MHRFRLGELLKPAAEICGCRQFTSVQLGVATRQPADIRAVVRGLILQGGKRKNFGPCGAPACQQMWIDKGKGIVLGQCDTLTGGCDFGWWGCR